MGKWLPDNNFAAQAMIIGDTVLNPIRWGSRRCAHFSVGLEHFQAAKEFLQQDLEGEELAVLYGWIYVIGRFTCDFVVLADNATKQQYVETWEDFLAGKTTAQECAKAQGNLFGYQPCKINSYLSSGSIYPSEDFQDFLFSLNELNGKALIHKLDAGFEDLVAEQLAMEEPQ